MPRRRYLYILPVALVLAACGSESQSNESTHAGDTAGNGGAGASGAGGTSGEQTGGASGGQTGGTGGTSTNTEPPPSSHCEALSLPIREFTAGEDKTALYSVASDFTVQTTDGDWNLLENWSGCDSHLFVPDTPVQNNPEFGYKMWEVPGDLPLLIERSPANVHYFFVSNAATEEERLAALGGLEQSLTAALPPEVADQWEGRVHYVTQEPKSIAGWLGRMLVRPGFGAAIDRFQRIRYIGSYAAPNHLDTKLDWPYGPNLGMSANEAVYYNFEADRAERLKAQEATVVSVWEKNPLAEDGSGKFQADVELPSKEEMAGFDTLELDLALTCVGSGEVGFCPAWDRNAYVYLCDATDPEVCDLEVGHWITTYHREGRWVHDVSGLLPLLAEGGQQRLAFQIQDPWEVTLSLRLSNQKKQIKPVLTIPLFGGQHTFNDAYNSKYPAQKIRIPADAKRVEIASAITGHGMASPGNCAEFCNTQHHFGVNGTDNLREFKIAGTQYGCQDQVSEGTVPNQYGTWWFGRGGWCPGKEVDLVNTDITDQVTLGEENDFTYAGFYRGDTYSGSTWNYIRMSSFLVVHR